MTAADITTKAYNWDHNPGQETVVLEVSDGETYTSRKFKKIHAAHVTGNTDVDTAGLNVTFTGQVATINWNGVSDNAVTLTLWGKK